MPALEKITASMFPDVYGSLLRELNVKIPEQRWKSAFVGRWPSDEDYLGYVMTEGSSMLGLLGLLFSRRSIGGRSVRFCNLHSWYVKPEHRARSLALLKPITGLKDHTITDFTSSANLSIILKRLGLIHLDGSAVMLPPLLRNGHMNGAVLCELADLSDTNCSHLSPADLQIFQDHQGIDCGHLLVRSGSDYCYVVYSRIERPVLPYCLVHYLSDPPLFAKYHAAIRSKLLRSTRAQNVVVDSRLLADVKIPFSMRIGAVEKLYRSTDVTPQQVDSLYSEMVLFKHSTIPGLRHRLTQTANRVLPAAVRRRIGLAS